MLQNSTAKFVGLFQDGGRDAGLGLGQEGGQPLAVDVDAVLDGLVLAEGQGEAVANDLHEPDDLGFTGQSRRLGVFRRGQPELEVNDVKLFIFVTDGVGGFVPSKYLTD
jgi:hypothetical protein